MMLIKLLRMILPTKFKRRLRLKLDNTIRKLKAPRMLRGYRDASGVWRDRTRISSTVFFNHPENIYIDDNVYIGHYSILDGTGGLVIGEGCQIAAWNGLYTHSSHIAIRIYGSHYQEVPESQKVGFKIGQIKLGKYVFVGAGAMIFPGVTIDDGAFIHAGSIVTKNVEKFAIVSGNPAKIIGDTRKLDEQYLESSQLLSWYNEWQKT